MTLKDISFKNPERNLEFDDNLLARAEQKKTGEMLRFWEAEAPFIVLGKTSSAQEDVFLEKTQRDGIKVLRRSSGGGTVVQAPGCLNYTLILSKTSRVLLREISSSYQYILHLIMHSLKQYGVKAMFFPPCDLATKKEKQKFSGNAQRRSKTYVLHHGTILYDFDFSLVEKYLKIPKKFPSYRQGRSHKDFLTNIPLPKYAIKDCIVQCFHAKRVKNF